jgi:hypothetical protein
MRPAHRLGAALFRWYRANRGASCAPGSPSTTTRLNGALTGFPGEHLTIGAEITVDRLRQVVLAVAGAGLGPDAEQRGKDRGLEAG